jgi:hypothetical protein
MFVQYIEETPEALGILLMQNLLNGLLRNSRVGGVADVMEQVGGRFPQLQAQTDRLFSQSDDAILREIQGHTPQLNLNLPHALEWIAKLKAELYPSDVLDETEIEV